MLPESNLAVSCRSANGMLEGYHVAPKLDSIIIPVRRIIRAAAKYPTECSA